MFRLTPGHCLVCDVGQSVYSKKRSEMGIVMLMLGTHSLEWKQNFAVICVELYRTTYAKGTLSNVLAMLGHSLEGAIVQPF